MSRREEDEEDGRVIKRVSGCLRKEDTSQERRFKSSEPFTPCRPGLSHESKNKRQSRIL
jgi:hypothetical protein